jgi:hypothetical protein
MCRAAHVALLGLLITVGCQSPNPNYSPSTTDMVMVTHGPPPPLVDLASHPVDDLSADVDMSKQHDMSSVDLSKHHDLSSAHDFSHAPEDLAHPPSDLKPADMGDRVCGPTCSRCETGACCGNSCCGAGEWCDNGTCRCGSGPACVMGQPCVAALPPILPVSHCGTMCCTTCPTL